MDRDNSEYFEKSCREQTDRLIWSLQRCDSREYRDVLASLVRHLEISSGHYDASEDEIRSMRQAAAAASGSCGSATIRRDVQRRDLDELIDDLFRPVVDAMSRDGTDAPEAFLLMRDLRRALGGDRDMGNMHPKWGIVFEEDLFPGTYRARELQRAVRVPVLEVSSVDELRGCAGIILQGEISGRTAFLAGVAIGSRIPAAVADGMMRPNDFGLPVFRKEAEALDHLRSGMAEGEHPLDINAEMQKACLEARGLLLEQENASIRKSMERYLDRIASRDVEIIKLVREHGIEKEYFDIYANGSRPNSEPVYARRLNAARHEIERLQKKIDGLEADAGSPQP